jgi:D-amino-acid dehydrogenase
LGARHVTVVGAGIVGTCCALQLRLDGHEVTLVDEREPGTATSFGNAGILSSGSIMPYATPGLWKAAPGMLLDPLGPLMLSWRYLPRAAPWLLRYLAEGRTSRAHAVAAEMAPLTAAACDAHHSLMAAGDIEAELIRRDGYLHVWREAKGFEQTALQRALMAEHGIACEVLDGDGIAALEPGLARDFRHGFHVAEGGFAVEPVALTQAYAAAFEARGGSILRQRVTGFEMADPGPRRLVTDSAKHPLDLLLLAAGAWSRPLLRELGLDAPLESERGYHLSLRPGEGVALSRPVVVGKPRYTLAPMRDGLRLTMGAEFGGLEAPPNYRRIHRLVADANRALPGLGDTVEREWMGHRPVLWDSKPAIGRSPHHDTVFYAFGHGHLGLTLGAVTARLIAELIGGQEPPLAPFSLARF